MLKLAPTFLFLILFLAGCRDKEIDQTRILTLKPTDFTWKLPVDGEFYSADQTELIVPAGINGSVISMVKPGSPVKKGEVVMVIRSEDLENRLKRELKALERARRSLKEGERKIIKERLELNLKINEAKFSCAVKEREIHYAMGEKNPKVIEAMDLKISLQEQKSIVLAKRLASYEELSRQNSISVDELERVRKDLKKNQLGKALDEAEKASRVEGKSGEEREKLLLEMELLNKELEKAKEQLVAREKEFPLELEKLSLVVSKKEKDLKTIQDRLETAKLKAPQDGWFFQGKHPWRGTIIEEGSPVYSGRSAGRVLNYDSLQVRLRIPERWVDQVRPGQVATLTTLYSAHAMAPCTVDRVESVATPYNNDDNKSRKFHWAHLKLTDKKGFFPLESVEGTVVLSSFSGVFALPAELVGRGEDGESLSPAKVISGAVELQTPAGLVTKALVSDVGDWILVEAGKDESLEVSW